HVCLRVLCGSGRCRQHRDRRKGEHKQTRLPPTRERRNPTHELRPLPRARVPCKGITVCPKSRSRRPGGLDGPHGNLRCHWGGSHAVAAGFATWCAIQLKVAFRTSGNVSRFAPRGSKE